MIEQYLAENEMSQVDFANLVNVHPSMVWQWINNERPISAIKAREIEEATSGAITRYMLRPDVFGSEPERKRK